MSSSLSSEVAIVGAGPAGLAAAIVLARQGIHVRLLDRQSLPADKACGEGIMPPGLAFLEEIGAAALLPAADRFPFAGIRYCSAAGRHAEADFAEGPGRGVRRTALSQALRRVAADLPTLTLHEGIRVTALHRSDHHMTLNCENAPPVTARLVVGADGLRSQVRRWAGLAGRPARRQRFGIRQHFRIAPWSRFVEVHSGPACEAYLTPCGPDQVGLAILWDRDRTPIPSAATGRHLFAALLAHFPVLHAHLAAASPLSAPRSSGPFDQPTTRRTAPGVVLLGDASGYLDPCTGEGLTLAFKQARALARCVPSALAAHPSTILSRADLRPYERAWRRLTRPYFLSTRFMLFSQRHPAAHERLLALLAHRPDLLRHLLSFNMGTAALLPPLRRTARWLVPGRAIRPDLP